MRPFLLFLCVATSCTSKTSAFNFAGDGNKKFTAFPGLDKLTQKQQGASLQISLVIEKPHSSLAKFALDGLQVELLPQPASASTDTSTTTSSSMNMPCANGPSPQFSSGKRALRLLQNPSFIDTNGRQTVALENGCWELVWREGDICGNLICGFDVPYEVSFEKYVATLLVIIIFDTLYSLQCKCRNKNLLIL